MTKLIALVGSALVATALAAPYGDAAKGKWGDELEAKFDDLTALPLAALEVGEYQGLNYDGFDVLELTGLAGPIAQSPSNVIVSSLTSIVNKVSITTQGTETRAFDLDEVFFACVKATTLIVEDCTVHATGYNYKNKKVAEQSFTFERSGGTTDRMVRVEFEDFKHLSHVDFTVTNDQSSVGDPITNVIFDNIEYTVYGPHKGGKPEGEYPKEGEEEEKKEEEETKW